MRKLLIWSLLISTLYAASDYFEILDKELDQSLNGQVRTFYISAEESIWDYASECSTKTNVPAANALGTRYYKALYHEYTDASFTKRKERPHWQGNMGPILTAEVGDTIEIHFWNKATRNYTIHPHGVFYQFEMEGAIFKGAYESSAIRPNQTYTYSWKVLPRAGPGPADKDSLVWGYHSHIEESDLYAGMYGAIVVFRKGKFRKDPIVTSLFVADENASPYLGRTMSTLYPNTKLNETERKIANRFNVINGLIASTPNDLVVRKKSTDWHLLGWGTYWDVQYVKWEKGKVEWNDEIVSNVRLMPASFKTITLTSNSSGLFNFGSLDNQKGGMIMQYAVDIK